MNEEKTKSFAVSKEMVYNSYLKVCDKNGSAGIDRETIEMFNENLDSNLYKVWNRMSSGSYFPPAVRTVLIPKKQGGTRPLGIPTVGDRIAQGVVKDFLEPILEPLFHVNSFGYRPGRSAHGALAQCQHNCIHHSWVVDLDIKGFFDNISHEWMMKMLRHHTQEKWVLLYTERWLKAGIEQADGSIAARQKGTPQGGVISPLLANLYLHHAFDMWMSKYFPSNPFERMRMMSLCIVTTRKKPNNYYRLYGKDWQVLTLNCIRRKQNWCTAKTTGEKNNMSITALRF